MINLVTDVTYLVSDVGHVRLLENFHSRTINQTRDVGGLPYLTQRGLVLPCEATAFNLKSIIKSIQVIYVYQYKLTSMISFALAWPSKLALLQLLSLGFGRKL